LGTTAVTYTATDASGNTATCKFNVIVKNNTNPVFTACPIADIQPTATAGCVATVNWTPPTATVNCGSVNVSSSHQPGENFPIGTTVVTYSATSETGGLTTCSFNVVVKDALAPVISGCSNITVIANGSCEAVASWETPSTTDCSVVTLTSSHQPGDSFPIGETEVTYSATDEYGNRTTCGFVVKVEDKTPPIFQYCPATLKALTDISCSAKLTWTEPILADNCGATTLTRSHAPGQVFPIGTTIVTYTGTDAAGNTASCQFSVIVTTEELPVISNCPLDLTIESDEEGQATVTWAEPIASTACGPVTLTSSIQPGDRFPIGTTVVEYKATNSNGNTASCTFNVTVLQAPIEIELSKLITPDGNQQNDEWIITNIEKYRDNKVIIVDRWGSLIYSASGYNNTNIVWTGSNRAGSLAPTGTYFYTFSVRYGPAWIERTGFIELIR
jgi:gliding motility-associated-like protein